MPINTAGERRGKPYPTKAQALKQGRAIIISQKKAGKKVK